MSAREPASKAPLTPAQRVAATYDAAADSYDHPANAFWARFGRGTIERLGLRLGDRVLDVCCGSGGSAIPAAEAVGPTESVIGIDFADNLLALARSKARDRALRNIALLRDANFAYIRNLGVRFVQTSVVYAIATKP